MRSRSAAAGRAAMSSFLGAPTPQAGGEIDKRPKMKPNSKRWLLIRAPDSGTPFFPSLPPNRHTPERCMLTERHGEKKFWNADAKCERCARVARTSVCTVTLPTGSVVTAPFSLSLFFSPFLKFQMHHPIQMKPADSEKTSGK